MFSITALPATVGDSLLLRYGEGSDLHHVLIDGGTGGTAARVAPILDALPHLELLVVTHVDDDHINGILKRLGDGRQLGTVGDVWFNGYRHTSDAPIGAEHFGQGDHLAELLESLPLPWNTAFFGQAVTLENFAALRATQATPAPLRLPGGLTLRVLSPRRADLLALRPAWAKETGKDPNAPDEPLEPDFEPMALETLATPPDVAALAQEPFELDGSEPNRSSIALVAEYGGMRMLLAGDAHPDVLLAALADDDPAPRHTFELVKLSHHGARGTNPLELMQRLAARHILISSSGGRFRHPHPQTIARLLTGKQGEATLHFNYRSTANSVWDNETLKRVWGYATEYPATNADGITVTLAD